MKKLGFKPILPVWDWLTSRRAWRPEREDRMAIGKRLVRQRMIPKPASCAQPKACARWLMEHPTIIACSGPAKRALTAIIGVEFGGVAFGGIESVNGSAFRAPGIE